MDTNDFKGHLFLTPAAIDGEENATIHVALGTLSNFDFPPYHQVLEGVVSEEIYNNVRQDFSSKVEKASTLSCGATGCCCVDLMECCCFLCCACCVGICCVAKLEEKKRECHEQLNHQATHLEWRWPTTLEDIKEYRVVDYGERGHGFDERGFSPVIPVTNTDNVPQSKPIWPPTGLNLIIKVRDPLIRARWPKNPYHFILSTLL